MGRMVAAVLALPAPFANRNPLAAPLAVLLLLCSGCATVDDEALQRRPRKPLEAFCQAHVIGVGIVEIESDYLPHVMHCENGGAPFSSLKAQAVAARSYLYYRLETAGAIHDGENDQVYSCGGSPTAEEVLAVEETSGQVLAYGSKTLCAFYVAGAKQTAPTCQGNTEHYTERFVTYNWGLSGSDLHQSSLGLIHPDNIRNRGCMSQWGSRCLAGADWMYRDILKFYYGADVTLETASGPCIIASNQPPRGGIERVDCDEVSGWVQDPDDPGLPMDVQVWFDGAPGASGAYSVVTTARYPREDLCSDTGQCAHAFRLRLPFGLRDNVAHGVHVLALDTDGGIDAKLEGSPTSFRCQPPAPPYLPTTGVRRRVTTLDALGAWGLTLEEDAVRWSDAEVEEYAMGPSWPASPDWIRRANGELWIADSGTVRALSARGSSSAWRIGEHATRAWSASDAELPPASHFPAAPYLVVNPRGEVYVIDRYLAE